MTAQNIWEHANRENLTAALIAPQDVPVDYKFRQFCEQNLCGNYGTNYACPPDCGTPEDLHQKLLAEEQVLIVQSVWEISDYTDRPAVEHAKNTHNAAVRRLVQQLKADGYDGFCAGYNGCHLCDVCNCVKQLPCVHPDLRVDCLSSYCVDVAELARRCNLEFTWSRTKLHLFGMIALHKVSSR